MTRLLLVHIARTGGTSLRRLLKATPATSSFDCVHNGCLLRFRDGRRIDRRPLVPRELGSYDLAVLMMRHPLARLRSCYQYFLHGGLNRGGTGNFPADRAIQRFLKQQAPTLAACCQHLPQVAERIPHFRPASHWLDQIPSPMADQVLTVRQERFTADLQRLFQLLDVDAAGLRVERVNTSAATVDESMALPTVRMAEQFYAEDFRRFGDECSALPPPRLIQYWDQPVPPGPLLERMEQWRQFHPAWSYKRYDRQSAAVFIGTIYGPALEEAFRDIRMPAMQADVFRIAALLAQGGVWIDAATTCRQPLETWLDRRQPLLLLRRAHQRHPKVWNGFIHAADPDHPLLLAAWQRITKALLARCGDRIYRDFGPRVLRDLLAEGDPELRTGLKVLAETELQNQRVKGSSTEFLPREQHWSIREQSESLYFSGGTPSASH